MSRQLASSTAHAGDGIAAFLSLAPRSIRERWPVAGGGRMSGRLHVVSHEYSRRLHPVSHQTAVPCHASRAPETPPTAGLTNRRRDGSNERLSLKVALNGWPNQPIQRTEMQQYRVNFGLLIGLIVGTLVVSAATYGLWLFQIDRNADTLIAAGEEAQKAGDFRTAVARIQQLSLDSTRRRCGSHQAGESVGRRDRATRRPTRGLGPIDRYSGRHRACACRRKRPCSIGSSICTAGSIRCSNRSTTSAACWKSIRTTPNCRCCRWST